MTSSRHQLSDRYSAKWDGQQLIAYRQYRNTERPLCYLNITALLKVASDSLCKWLDSKSNFKRNSPASIPNTIQAVSGTKSSQWRRLLAHFEKGGSVTRLTALDVMGGFELSSRVGEVNDYLAWTGVSTRVVSEWIKVPNRFGETVRVRKYYLGRDQ